MQQRESSAGPAVLSSAQDDGQRQRKDTWPGDRVPAPSDAEMAYRSLDPRLLSVFKQAMLADSEARKQTRVLSAENVQVLRQQAASSENLSWPLALFSASLQPTEMFELNELIHTCHDLFLCRSPFVKYVSSSVFLRTQRPEYLTLAMASIGALMSPQREEQSLQLWHTAASQLLGMLDVDNSLARKTDLVNAWILLETFSILSSDREVRRRARMSHGCVKTAVWRILREAPYFNESSNVDPVQSQRTGHERMIMSYFLLIDLLRSIQSGQSTSFPTVLFLRPKHHQVNDGVGVASPLVRLVDEHFEDSLISILSLLADTHMITTVFNPLAIQSSLTSDSLTRSPAIRTTDVPFTPGHEIKQLRQKVMAGLAEWERVHCESASKDVILLYHLCRLHNLAPSIQALFVLSGYTNPTFTPFCQPREENGASESLLEYIVAIPTAWLILETSEKLLLEELPIWAPLSVFSAGLVVWARKEFAKDDDFHSLSARSLGLFHKELLRMKFPGAREMSTILANLGHRSRRQVSLS